MTMEMNTLYLTFFRNKMEWALCRWSRGSMLGRLAGRLVASHPISYGMFKAPFSSAPVPSSRIFPPYRQTVGIER
jgi:hypothetical protein